jgi:YhcH/YjgK/YiaL family protein
MLLDHLSNAKLYYMVSPHIARALQWLTDNAPLLHTYENGRIDIDGDNVYAIVNSYDTKPAADCGWEAHRRYADIHYSVQGAERIGYCHISGMTLKQEHNEEKDYALYTGSGDWLRVAEGMFCILLPEDVHAPGAMVADQPQLLKKVVMKVIV